MTTLGTPLSPSGTRVMLLGSGELGKEVGIELQRFGCEVIAVDRYPNAPAMQVAHRSHVVNMLDGAALRAVIESERPHLIVPEIEAIATPTLIELEDGRLHGHPDRARSAADDGPRRHPPTRGETLGLRTSPYRFADTEARLSRRRRELGMPCVVKPVMSSSGKGQSVVRSASGHRARMDVLAARRTRRRRPHHRGRLHPTSTTRSRCSRCGTADRRRFCEPIGHLQIDGDYRESWQPQPMSAPALAESQRIARAITEKLGGNGMFGVELFVAGDTIYFSEVSPRPHDTGLVTLISQDLSEFALHARAILGLPIPVIRQRGPSASCALLVEGDSANVRFENVERALAQPIRHCACSENLKCADIAAWAFPSRWEKRSRRRGRKRGR